MMVKVDPLSPHGTLYLLHGDDSLAIHRAVMELIAQEGVSQEDAGTNVTWLDGSNATVDEMYGAAYTLPFFTGKTMVVITNPTVKILSKEPQEKFIRLLEGLPETTLLILVIEDKYEPYGKKKGWQKLGEKSWLGKWAKAARPGYAYKIYKLPELSAMPEVIRREAEKQGGKISPSAARELAGRIGNDTYLASQEITKLLEYVNFKRTIEIDDIRQVAVSGGMARVFDMTDAAAYGNSREAIHLLHVLLSEEEPEYLFSMIVRQFRLLIQAREILNGGGNPQALVNTLRVPDFVAGKLMTQVRRFKAEDLARIYHRLLEIDFETKVSAVTLDVAMDELIVGLGKG
jgi:DNA polymerase-3 subunit delta